MSEKKIYITDDEHSIREAIKTFLESSGYVVEDFENGEICCLKHFRKILLI